MGLIHRIGDGKTTEVWHDNWIVSTTSLRPVAHISKDLVHLVADLIMEDTGNWDDDLVR